MARSDFDLIIIGAGVIGCAIAREITQRSSRTVLVLDQYAKPGMGVSSRNSEVIHAGIYYNPGSLRAQHCIAGRDLLYHYAEDNSIPYKKCGKLIVASDASQEPALADLQKNALKNGVELVNLSAKEVVQREPNIRCTAALFSAQSGIIDVHRYVYQLASDAQGAGATFAHHTRVICITRLADRWRVEAENTQQKAEHDGSYSVSAPCIINCAGLFADHVATLAGINCDSANYKLCWLKGSYFSLSSAWTRRFSHLVYPLPEANLAGLGVHLTIDTIGAARLGPDVQQLSTRAEDYRVDESLQNAFYAAARQYLPNLKPDDLSPMMAGIRPSRSGKGQAKMDFVIAEETAHGAPGLINVLGIDSPGITASLSIAREVATICEGC